jgi:hypothetical protein
MPYSVTFETFYASNVPGPVGIDPGPQPQGFNLKDALDHACQLIAERKATRHDYRWCRTRYLGR